MQPDVALLTAHNNNARQQGCFLRSIDNASTMIGDTATRTYAVPCLPGGMKSGLQILEHVLFLVLSMRRVKGGVRLLLLALHSGLNYGHRAGRTCVWPTTVGAGDCGPYSARVDLMTVPLVEIGNSFLQNKKTTRGSHVLRRYRTRARRRKTSATEARGTEKKTLPASGNNRRYVQPRAARRAALRMGAPPLDSATLRQFYLHLVDRLAEVRVRAECVLLARANHERVHTHAGESEHSA